MMLLAIDWHVIGVKALQLIFSLSILVVLHEFGHYITAKWFGCRVEKFYLFFDPWFSVFKKKIKDTEYGIGWLPLGGYVKIAGMIDESMDKEQLNQPAQPWEFRSKPAWQRLIIMLAGIVVNVLLAIFIYGMMLFVWGEKYLPAKNVQYGIATDSLARSVGLKDGDIVISVGNKDVDDFNSITGAIVLDEAKLMTVKRDQQIVNINLPEGTIRQIIKRKGQPFVEPRMPFIVNKFPAVSPAQKAGLQKADKIISIDSVATPYYNDATTYLKNKKDNDISLGFIRGTDTLHKTIHVSPDGKLGIFAEGNLDSLGLVTKTKTYTFFESIPAGFSKTFEILAKYMTNLRMIFTSKEVKVSESVGGFLSIGNLFPDEWDWKSFWNLTALLSIILAFMNILPIPALDGGHALFTIIEMITGRKPSMKFMEYAQIAGMVLLLGLMLYVNGLDIFRLFNK